MNGCITPTPGERRNHVQVFTRQAWTLGVRVRHLNMNACTADDCSTF
ncbi:hypothetical protein X961_5753 [Burkholderia pseudomallei MSHR5613]|nr:hypothetical protein X961_5753 [Burkholderia pseudomallei MSHR5613]